MGRLDSVEAGRLDAADRGGAGIGASHQTGRTGLAAPSATLFHGLDARDLPAGGVDAAFRPRCRRGAGTSSRSTVGKGLSDG